MARLCRDGGIHKRDVEDGAGVRWTPLHFNAEAPIEPAGETLSAMLTEGIKKYRNTEDGVPYETMKQHTVGVGVPDDPLGHRIY